MNRLDLIENISIVFGFTVSVATIETILGIIILIFQIVILITKGIMKIVKHYKEKNYKAMLDDGKEMVEGLQNLKDTTEKKNGDK